MLAASIVASALALVAVQTLGAAPLSTGGPPGGFVIPTGSIASFTNLTFAACNRLTWGYQVNGGPNQPQFIFPGGCGGGTASGVTIGPFASPASLRVFLEDDHCGSTYYSDGTPVDHVIVAGSNPFSLRFADSGGFCEHAATTFNAFTGCNFCVTLAITDAPITASGKGVSAVEGANITATVATFTDPDATATAADYTATISWGDGGSSTGVITGGAGFDVSGSHTYAEEGTFTISVTITDADDPSNSATTTSTASVSDAALTAKAACSATALGAYSGQTATFTDSAGSLGTAGDFAATIDWGDGAVTAGTVASTGTGAYGVTGSHDYSSIGAFTIKTTIKDDGGSVAVTSCDTIGFSFAPGGGAFVVEGQPTGLGQTVTFWDAQWGKSNLPGKAGAAYRFKGFADSPASPACGVTWTGDPGNSAPPPAGSLPEYMGVIVTSSTSQSGSRVSGTVVHILVVKTSPGYAPNPGHPGTGSVVAVFC